jgi:hypothetical protein
MRVPASAARRSILFCTPPLALAALLATACANAPDPLLGPVEVPALDSHASPVLVSRTTAAVDHAVLHPCTAEIVDLVGQLRLEVLTRALDADRSELTTMIQATHVTGRVRSGDGVYRVEGAARVQTTARHRDRAVTSADFRSIAIGPPGAQVHRANVSPLVRVTLSFPVPVAGKIFEATVDAVSFDQKCSADDGVQ